MCLDAGFWRRLQTCEKENVVARSAGSFLASPSVGRSTSWKEIGRPLPVSDANTWSCIWIGVGSSRFAHSLRGGMHLYITFRGTGA